MKIETKINLLKCPYCGFALYEQWWANGNTEYYCRNGCNNGSYIDIDDENRNTN